MKKSIQTTARHTDDRKGVAALEAAVVMPLMLVLVLGTIEMGTALRASTIMQSSVREAGRMANMNWSTMVAPGESPNDKIERDLENYIVASGLSVEGLNISITHAEGPNVGQEFDISDPTNDLEMMSISLQLPYSSISLFPTHHMKGKSVMATLVMRAGMGSGLSN